MHPVTTPAALPAAPCGSGTAGWPRSERDHAPVRPCRMDAGPRLYADGAVGGGATTAV